MSVSVLHTRTPRPTLLFQSPPGLGDRLRARLAGRRRASLAAGLERAVTASPARGGLTAAVPVDARAVELARPELLTLAARLRDPRWVDPGAVRTARRLLCDSCSPLYCPRRPGELREQALQLLAAMGAAGSEERRLAA